MERIFTPADLSAALVGAPVALRRRVCAADPARLRTSSLSRRKSPRPTIHRGVTACSHSLGPRGQRDALVCVGRSAEPREVRLARRRWSAWRSERGMQEGAVVFVTAAQAVEPQAGERSLRVLGRNSRPAQQAVAAGQARPGPSRVAAARLMPLSRRAPRRCAITRNGG